MEYALADDVPLLSGSVKDVNSPHPADARSSPREVYSRSGTRFTTLEGGKSKT